MSGDCRDWGHTPIWIGHGGCASTLESVSPLLSSSGSSWIAGRLTKPALNPEEPLPGTACPWVGRARGGQYGEAKRRAHDHDHLHHLLQLLG